tara:strand:- start:644 stop:1909 length:1266 start_codon:yes stop_codon:yes gene_type:complete
MSISNYSSEFEKILNRDYFSKDLHPYRKDAFSQLTKEGFPNKKWEEWRFTNLSKIIKGGYRISESNDAPKQDDFLDTYNLDKIDTIVIYNGHYIKDLSSAPEGIKLLNGEEYLSQNNNKFECINNSPFDLLNTAFVDSGINIVVEKNKNIKNPIRILFLSNGEDSIMVNPRLHLDIDDSSNLTFIEHHVGDAKSFFQNQSIFITAKDNASVEHIRIQSNSENTQNIFNLNINQSKDSNYNFYQYIDGGELTRTNLSVNLNGQNAKCNINSLSISNDKQHVDNNIVVNHNSPNTFSSQFVKSILFDSSSGVFNGRTVVKEDAQKIIAHQTNKNLLLSNTAKMNSNPQLEIYADDVKCSHGSTTGEIDDDSLFYIQSRGIPKSEAIKLIVNGFANEAIKDIPNQEVFLFLQNRILELLKNMVK